MIKPGDQLTKRQMLGMALLGISSWAILGGIYWAIAEDVEDGAIIFAAGVIGCYVMYRWLIAVNPRNR